MAAQFKFGSGLHRVVENIEFRDLHLWRRLFVAEAIGVKPVNAVGATHHQGAIGQFAGRLAVELGINKAIGAKIVPEGFCLRVKARQAVVSTPKCRNDASLYRRYYLHPSSHHQRKTQINIFHLCNSTDFRHLFIRKNTLDQLLQKKSNQNVKELLSKQLKIF